MGNQLNFRDPGAFVPSCSECHSNLIRHVAQLEGSESIQISYTCNTCAVTISTRSPERI
jgi:hypothetical protein